MPPTLMQQSTDHRNEQLWKALKKGDEKALSELILLYADSLYSYGFLLCRNRETVEDCIQDLFLHLWQKRGELADIVSVRTYLTAALRNRITDAFRRIKGALHEDLRDEDLATESSPEQQLIESEVHSLETDLVKRSVEALPARMKQAIYLRYYAGFGYQEIAQIMEVSQQVAVNMVHRAVLKLRSASRHYSDWLSFSLLFFLFS